MLVLSRRLHETIVLPDVPVTVEVVSIKAGVVRLGITAPTRVAVLRGEVRDRQGDWGVPAPAAATTTEGEAWLRDLLNNRLRVTEGGLAVLRRQLDAGLDVEAGVTLEKLEEEVQMLRQRLERENKPARPRSAPPSHKALLVEDNANERELMAMFLRSAGMDVATAGDGVVALDYLQSRDRPDVVLLDMGMPRCDGPTTVRAIRANPAYAGLKIFAVSGHSPEEFNLERGPAGLDGWFHKPIDPAELVRYLNQELDAVPSRS